MVHITNNLFRLLRYNPTPKICYVPRPMLAYIISDEAGHNSQYLKVLRCGGVYSQDGVALYVKISFSGICFC